MSRLIPIGCIALPLLFLAAVDGNRAAPHGNRAAVDDDRAALAGDRAAEKTDKAEGEWTPLFDGKSLDGWRTLGGKAIAGWEAKDGVLRFVPSKGAAGQDIYTEKEYSSFILDLEWKIPEGGNSGVKYRMRWYEEEYLGPEYQILGEKPEPGARRGASKGLTGALYDIIPIDLSARDLRPADRWNAARIVADGPRIEHWLNGKKLVDVDVTSDEFKAAIAASKFRSREGFAQNASGRIMLQYHGSEVSFRNIRIQELP